MGLYDEVEIEDMEWSDELEAFTYSCPCGDLFQITLVCCHLRIFMSVELHRRRKACLAAAFYLAVAFSATDSIA